MNIKNWQPNFSNGKGGNQEQGDLTSQNKYKKFPAKISPHAQTLYTTSLTNKHTIHTTMHHGQKAVELIRDLVRATDALPPYNV
jgi:hypothetical protein